MLLCRIYKQTNHVSIVRTWQKHFYISNLINEVSKYLEKLFEWSIENHFNMQVIKGWKNALLVTDLYQSLSETHQIVY